MDTVAWQAVLAVATAAFTRPAFRIFREVACGWILCPVRRTITGMIPTADPDRKRSHDAFHHFFRDARWLIENLWRSQPLALVAALCPPDLPLLLLVDDTLIHRHGRHVEGAGDFRDAVRSTARRTVFAHGLNVVALCVCVRVPGLCQPIALTVNTRTFEKGGPSHVTLAAIMLKELATWLPQHRFRLVGDGAYASLAKLPLPRTRVVSRLRRDAALYERPAPRRPGTPGRPPKKGVRLAAPPGIAAQAAATEWKAVDVRQRYRTVKRLLLTRVVLWYEVTGENPLLLVIVRDPSGHEHDDYFFTTDIEADPAAVAADYSDRWPIEVTFRDTKQLLTPQHVQSWRRFGPTRAADLGFWLHAAVWSWFLPSVRDKSFWPDRPWYTRKRSASFADALAALRGTLWTDRISPLLAPAPESAETIKAIIASLARAG